MAEQLGTEMATLALGIQPEVGKTQPAEKQNASDQPAVIDVNTSQTDDRVAPLSCVTFTPDKLEEAPSKDELPVFAPFSTLVDKANQWLRDHPEVTVWKCESILFKLLPDSTLPVDASVFLESAYGINKFVLGLRMWVVPRLSDSIPIAEIGYTTALPGWHQCIKEPEQPTIQDFFSSLQKTLLPQGDEGTPALLMSESKNTADDSTPKQTNDEQNEEVTKDMKETGQDNEGEVDQSKTSPEDSQNEDKSLEQEMKESENKDNKTLDEVKGQENQEKTQTADKTEEEKKEAKRKLIEVSLTTTFSDCLKNMNRQLSKKPLPGVILNVEMVTMRASNKANAPVLIDPDATCWAEDGGQSRAYVSAIRIFFIKGKPDFAIIGYHDESPKMTQIMSIIKYGPFSDMVNRTGEWLKKQNNIRVLNMQTINIKCSTDRAGNFGVHRNSTGHIELAYSETKYTKILRTFYVTSRKQEMSPYQPITLTTRLFPPVSKTDNYRNYETFSQTLERMIKWMKLTQIPPFAVETIQYQVFPGSQVNEERVDTSVWRTNGRHQLTTIRLYLPSEFIEPPPEIAPEVSQADAYRYGCTIS